MTMTRTRLWIEQGVTRIAQSECTRQLARRGLSQSHGTSRVATDRLSLQSLETRDGVQSFIESRMVDMVICRLLQVPECSTKLVRGYEHPRAYTCLPPTCHSFEEIKDKISLTRLCHQMIGTGTGFPESLYHDMVRIKGLITFFYLYAVNEALVGVASEEHGLEDAVSEALVRVVFNRQNRGILSLCMLVRRLFE